MSTSLAPEASPSLAPEEALPSTNPAIPAEPSTDTELIPQRKVPKTREDALAQTAGEWGNGGAKRL
jgi:hypothetical protein